MIQCMWSILCEKSIYNQETERVSLIEILERLEIPPFPDSEESVFIPFEFELVTWWKVINETDEIDTYRVTILNPFDEILLQLEHPLGLDQSIRRAITKLSFPAGMPIASLGDYKFKIEIPDQESENKWREVGSVSLSVEPSTPELDNE